MNILLLEDNELFASSLIDFLQSEDFNITHSNNGEDFLSLTYENNYDLYLLDINVPKINGLESLKLLRESSNTTPSIFLTSYKDKETLKDAYLSGGDDYMIKPFDLDELVLRINALIKRTGKLIENININGIEYNFKSKSFTKDSKNIILSKKVIDLFELFMQNKNEIISKELIISTLWSASEEFSDGAIRVYISKLRDLFGSDTILNIKGQGYKFQIK